MDGVKHSMGKWDCIIGFPPCTYLTMVATRHHSLRFTPLDKINRRTLYTKRTGQEFPEHITKDARATGWEHKKASSNWKDFCPECAEELRKIKRREALHNDP